MPTKTIKTKSGKFRVKYYAANGEMLAHSELLNSKQSANKNIKAMAKLFADAYEVSGSGEPVKINIR